MDENADEMIYQGLLGSSARIMTLATSMANQKRRAAADQIRARFVLRKEETVLRCKTLKPGAELVIQGPDMFQ